MRFLEVTGGLIESLEQRLVLVRSFFAAVCDRLADVVQHVREAIPRLLVGRLDLLELAEEFPNSLAKLLLTGLSSSFALF